MLQLSRHMLLADLRPMSWRQTFDKHLLFWAWKNGRHLKLDLETIRVRSPQWKLMKIDLKILDISGLIIAKLGFTNNEHQNSSDMNLQMTWCSQSPSNQQWMEYLQSRRASERFHLKPYLHEHSWIKKSYRISFSQQNVTWNVDCEDLATF